MEIWVKGNLPFPTFVFPAICFHSKVIDLEKMKILYESALGYLIYDQKGNVRKKKGRVLT